VRIEVLFFGQLREMTNCQNLAVELKSDANALDLLRVISQRFPASAGLLEVTSVSINNEYVAKETVLSDGDEVGLLPPISGG